MGSIRVLRLSRRDLRLTSQGVVGGTLYDGSGTRLGAASQRCQLPVEVSWSGGGELVVGPLDADLLGLRVHVEQVVLPSRRAANALTGAVGHAGRREVVPLSRSGS